ncbi:LuxR C-terminal-related transcriptional regulator [Sinirhodobacter sp. WL0062]|uniref:LuxR C-terminal-related transcriptional regulator n=1 Tax=Rhodobacter flavimaris TaxID=2907145 RepID=A0ABS8YVJ8_9RHOB|nr:helix-turn-helix transcriptional regulator [Sinirhodobacter sp. WL0062]MCE5972528.1 LuxR C-terminal-related transcriptional regulator [Sinirhodobacter sp. WL0062]
MESEALALDEGRIQAIAGLIEAVGSDRFPAAFRQFIRQVCGFDSLIATRYPANQPPVSLYHDLDDVQAAITVQFYATGPYLLDPLYLACKGGSAPGAYRLLDLAPEAFYRSQYYRAFYRSIRIGDEIGLLIREHASDWIIVSLARGLRQTRFSEQELAQLRQLFPILSVAVLRHWGCKPEAAPEGRLEDRLETFGVDILSPREAEIVRLILQGHSTPSAAAYLGISEGTVKVHRHHAYAKLGITSQAELFSLATRHFVG